MPDLFKTNVLVAAVLRKRAKTSNEMHKARHAETEINSTVKQVAVAYFAMNPFNSPSDKRRVVQCQESWNSKNKCVQSALRQRLNETNAITVNVVTVNRHEGKANHLEHEFSPAGVRRSAGKLLHFFAQYDAVFIVFDHAVVTQATVTTCSIYPGNVHLTTFAIP